MAITLHHKGRADTSGESVTANAAGSTGTRYYNGPAADKTLYGGKVNGRYILEQAGANGSYRWVEDYPIGASATPATGYTADNL